jgi:16S rRNA (guanine(1405)-N(7))-methyltransferase
VRPPVQVGLPRPFKYIYMPQITNTLDKLTLSLSQSKNYKNIYKPTLKLVASVCLVRYGEEEALDRAKNLLHQTWGAFWETRPKFSKLLNKIQADIGCHKEIGDDVKKEIVKPLLLLQSSVKERMPLLDTFYTKVFKITGAPNSIIDHACGLNPLTYLWMNLPVKTSYVAYDIDLPEIDFLNSIMNLFGVGDRVIAKAGDVLIEEFPYADVVFLFKSVMLFERQGGVDIRELLAKQKCKFLVVTFPTKSIGGNQKGMPEFYTEKFNGWSKDTEWKITFLTFATELCFIIEK